MNAVVPNSPVKSFFTWAAWYSLVTPFVTAAITFLVLFVESRTGYMEYDIVNFVLLCGFLLVISSLISGALSFFGVPRHGARVIVWKAIIGMLASCIVGLGIFVVSMGQALAHTP
jgi:hypothetical protein